MRVISGSEGKVANFEVFRQIIGKAGMNMVETYEKEGILYFKEPFRSDLVEWSDNHLGLNTIILKNNEDFKNRIINVIAVSTDKSYNHVLFDVKKTLKGVEILMGIPEEEINSID